MVVEIIEGPEGNTISNCSEGLGIEICDAQYPGCAVESGPLEDSRKSNRSPGSPSNSCSAVAHSGLRPLHEFLRCKGRLLKLRPILEEDTTCRVSVSQCSAWE